MDKLRVLDIFAGIGGFSLGLQRTGGFETIAFCEIEPFCQRVLAKHWPEVPIYGDVRELTAARLNADGIGRIDVICGGFPCQDISVAGRGAGLEGERSGLWFEYARLIGELRPRYVIVENVAALLGRGLGRVLGELSALGYDAEWHCIPAAAVGAPHRRDRVWIIAYAGGDVLREQSGRGSRPNGTSQALTGNDGTPRPLADPDFQSLEVGPRFGRHLAAQLAAVVRDRAALPDADGEGCPQPIGAGEALSRAGSREPARPERGRRDPWLAEPDVGGVVDGLPAELDGGCHGEKEHASEAGAQGDGDDIGLSGVRQQRPARAASPGLFEPGHRRGSLSDMPHQCGPERRDEAEENDAEVRALWDGVPADAQQKTHTLQPGMSVDRWPHERGETVGDVWRQEPSIGRVAADVANRVDRLKSLGNAVVPEIPEIIGQAILASINSQSEAA